MDQPPPDQPELPLTELPLTELPLTELPLTELPLTQPPHTDPPLTLNRRTFVGASAVAVGGQVVADSLAACSLLTSEPTVEPGQAVVTLTINGERRQVPVDTRTSLLDLLRKRVGLTATKKGCNQGARGACTILLDGRRVISCLTLAVMHDGAELTTIEGLADGDRLHAACAYPNIVTAVEQTAARA